jgi:hypothetical protein
MVSFLQGFPTKTLYSSSGTSYFLSGDQKGHKFKLLDLDVTKGSVLCVIFVASAHFSKDGSKLTDETDVQFLLPRPVKNVSV